MRALHGWSGFSASAKEEFSSERSHLEKLLGQNYKGAAKETSGAFVVGACTAKSAITNLGG